MSPHQTSTLLVNGIDDSKFVDSSGGNNRKLAKSDFTKPVQEAEVPSFLTLDARQTFTQLTQADTEASIFRHFDS